MNTTTTCKLGVCQISASSLAEAESEDHFAESMDSVFGLHKVYLVFIPFYEYDVYNFKFNSCHLESETKKLKLYKLIEIQHIYNHWLGKLTDSH